ELGALYSEEETEFKLWAPISEEVTLNLYTKGHDADTTDDDGDEGVDTPYDTKTMEQGDKGVWSTTVDGDMDGVYYTYTVNNDGTEHEVVDPYAYASGVNGERGMVINFDRHAPEDWEDDTRPDTIENPTDSIIYELHVRDLTSHESWNGTEDWRGKFLGLTERGTTHNGETTGLDHILDLGVTHVQLLPFFDHGIIDETRHNDPSYEDQHDGIFNWGYMPEHFNVLEGSYATDPYNGEVRVEEFKEVVKTFHDNDLRVVMDVVYNHTGKSADSNFDKILPGYYFRMNEDGTFSNGSGTGNETASEREMFRKFMVDSMKFWAEEYNIDGFRFDLMKLHDVETMNIIREEMDKIDEDILLYGEPWDAGGSKLPESESAYDGTLDEMPGIGAFNDTTRDGIKGSVFNASEQGFVQGNDYAAPRVMFGVAGGTSQKGLSVSGDALSPSQTINYVTAHDNNTLHDKLQLSSGADDDIIARMQRQSNGILFASQGVPFLHAGVEIMRTKPCVEPESGEDTCTGGFDHNSYRSPDAVNQFDWNWKSDHLDTFEYYRDMIELRKMKDVFRLDSSEAIGDALTFGPYEPGTVQYLLNDENDDWQTIVVLHNNGAETRDFVLPEGDTTFELIATSDEVGTIGDDTVESLDSFEGGETLSLERNESRILYSNDLIETFETESDEDDGDEDGGFFSCARRSETEEAPSSTSVLPMLGFVALIVGRFAFKKRK
ncbi:MAG: type I pullulanase, partial [Bacillota bacterium]